MRLFALLTLVMAMFSPASAAEPPKQRIEFNSQRIGVLGLPLAESKKPAYRITLTGDMVDMKDGNGVLILDLTEPPAYDEFGFVKTPAPVSEITLDCTLKFVKTTTRVYTARVGGPRSDKFQEERETWNLYSITGPKITSRMFLALPAEAAWPSGRFLVQGQDGTVKHAIALALPLPSEQPEDP